MKAAESRWSIHVWFWGFVFVFLSHAFAVFWLAEHESFSPAAPNPVAFLYLSGDPETDEHLARQAALRDPTLFALPHLNGFSGGAWLRFQPEAPRLSNWTAPLEWLALPAAELGRSLDDYMATNRPSEEHLLASLRATRAPEVRLPDPPLMTNSTVRVQGPLALRKLAFVPPLPSVFTNDVLSNTVVTVSVNRDGIIASTSVARGSGAKWADDQALQLARSFLFDPVPAQKRSAKEPVSITFGQLMFAWNTVPPTNAPAAAGTGSTPRP
jgi:TonB family protein